MAKAKKKKTGGQWVSKWALTEGIVQVEGRVTDSGKALACTPEFLGREVQVLKPDWFDTEKEARERAAVLRTEALATLSTQLEAATLALTDAVQRAKASKAKKAEAKKMTAAEVHRLEILTQRRDEIEALTF